MAILHSLEQNPYHHWKETPEAHVFKVDLPALTKYEVEALLYEEGNFLCIRGEREVLLEVKGDQWDHAERIVSTFVRRFKLPANAKPKNLNAYAENGVLTIILPKKKTIQQPVKYEVWFVTSVKETS